MFVKFSKNKVISNIIIFIFLFFQLFWFAITPFDIPNKVFHLDWQDIDGDWILTDNPEDGTLISWWVDKFWNFHTWFTFSWLQAPIFFSSGINSHSALYFNWINHILQIKDHLDINLNTWYDQKSFVLVFKTSGDINTFQTIYEQWWKDKWFAFQINWGNLYMWAWNLIDWASSYRIFNLWTIEPNTVYSLIFVFDSIGNISKAYLNGNLVVSLIWAETQTTHGSCTFDTSFDCNIYDTGGSIWIWGVQNDTLDIKSLAWYQAYQWSFFNWLIWEIIQYNYALTDLEVSWLFDYLFARWNIDLVAPIITWSNFLSWDLLPWWNHLIEFYYSDVHTGSQGINTGSYIINLYKRDDVLNNWSNNIASTGLALISITTTKATFQTQNLNYGKYLIEFSIADNAGNRSSVFSYIFYIDRPYFTISKSLIDIWILTGGLQSNSDWVNVEVWTIGAPFRIVVKKQTNLTYSGYVIQDYDWVLWYWISTGVVLNAFATGFVLASENWNLNVNGNLNTYNYSFNLWAIVDQYQTAWFYTWYIEIVVEFDY